MATNNAFGTPTGSYNHRGVVRRLRLGSPIALGPTCASPPRARFHHFGVAAKLRSRAALA